MIYTQDASFGKLAKQNFDKYKLNYVIVCFNKEDAKLYEEYFFEMFKEYKKGKITSKSFFIKHISGIFILNNMDTNKLIGLRLGGVLVSKRIQEEILWHDRSIAKQLHSFLEESELRMHIDDYFIKMSDGILDKEPPQNSDLVYND